MNSPLYQIVNVIENDNVVTVNYLCKNDPIPYSLFQCSFETDGTNYSIQEILQYCLKSEDYLDIRGLYSSDLEQSIAENLSNQIMQ
ncbi:hypothetical protein ACOI1C_09975 [Bacillus sp. DJP31]|uniref:hypothetical protein n=1 Tax=Bacillus sp. DJP31 TaxID=3409789 RepID=UPI003BB6273C